MDAPGSNEMAVRFLDALWQDGHRIYGVGGSDSHNLIDERYEEQSIRPFLEIRRLGMLRGSLCGKPDGRSESGTYVCDEILPDHTVHTRGRESISSGR